MGERADQLNDYEQTPYIPGGSMPQGDERSGPPSSETAGATGSNFVAAADSAASDVASGKTATRKSASGDLGTIGIGSDVDTGTGADVRVAPEQIRGDIKSTRAQAADTVKQTAMQAKDAAAQKLQGVTSQVNEKAGPVVQQAAAQAQQQARMVRDKYYELQERTGVEITPRMLGIAAGVLAGVVVALIAVIGRLRGQSAEEDEVIVADLPLDALPDGKYQITRID